jgi:hypothetical protein
MTSKGPPTRHSHYAAGVLAPLAALLDAPTVRAVDGRARSVLVKGVVGDVAARCARVAPCGCGATQCRVHFAPRWLYSPPLRI